MLIRSGAVPGDREDEHSRHTTAVDFSKSIRWDRDRKRLLILFAFVVVEIQRVDKVAKERESFVAGFGVGLLGDRFFDARALFFIEGHTGALEDVRFDVDRDIGAHCQGDRVARPCVDFHCMAALLDNNTREEGVIVDIVDEDVIDRGTKLAEDGFQKVVGHRALRLVALKRERDRVRFKGSDPDWKVSFAICLA